VFWVISVYFNIRNTLRKYYTFLPGHPVYVYNAKKRNQVETDAKKTTRETKEQMGR
jgi:predicted transcriptional regulator